MESLYPWLGDLNKELEPHWAGLVCTLASVFCGAFIGVDRERRDKPAGLRTLILICVGATVFTLVSRLIAESKQIADPARLASQIVPGIGFLGAGAIIQARGTVMGLTTGATIWAVAAVGVTIGSGYVAAGLVFSMVIFLTLSVVGKFDWIVAGRCRFTVMAITYLPDDGKTLPRLQAVLDRYHIADRLCVHQPATNGEAILKFRVCRRHREHRAILQELADTPGVRAIAEPDA